MKLSQLILEGIVYSKPNFEHEWGEAKRYPEFKEMGIERWIQTAQKGEPVLYSSIKDVLGNVDLNFKDLEEPKKQRFQAAFQKGIIEMPIAVKFSDKDYDLVAGNTRLSGLVKNGIDPKIWIVDLTEVPTKYGDKTPEDWEKRDWELYDENYADGKVKGKSRPGRVKRSGASCKGSVADLRAKAKKYGGEKGKMYHWCANMKGGKKK